jgi:peptidoglycan-associated lipoprotein
MKLTKFSNLIMGAALVLAAAGCHHAPPTITHLPNGSLPLAGSGGLNPDQTTPIAPADPKLMDTSLGIPPTEGHPPSDWDRMPDVLQGQTVYFEYDKSAVKVSEEFKLDEVAKYLKANPTHALLVEGNCDERGTEEYNRSLGERRSLSGRERLVQMGINASRIDTITYGEDKPAVKGHDEAAWSKNRRDDFVVLVPKATKVAMAQ